MLEHREQQMWKLLVGINFSEKMNWCKCQKKKEENITNARIQAVTPVPQEVTTGLSKEMPAEEYMVRFFVFLSSKY